MSGIGRQTREVSQLVSPPMTPRRRVSLRTLLLDWPIFDGLPLSVVSVADAVRPWTSGISPMFQRQAMDAYADDLHDVTQTAERVASAAAARLHAAGRPADATVRRGDPAAEIIAFAEERRADLSCSDLRSQRPRRNRPRQRCQECARRH